MVDTAVEALLPWQGTLYYTDIQLQVYLVHMTIVKMTFDLTQLLLQIPVQVLHDKETKTWVTHAHAVPCGSTILCVLQ